jgi:hypothetical protein
MVLSISILTKTLGWHSQPLELMAHETPVKAKAIPKVVELKEVQNVRLAKDLDQQDIYRGQKFVTKIVCYAKAIAN